MKEVLQKYGLDVFVNTLEPLKIGVVKELTDALNYAKSKGNLIELAPKDKKEYIKALNNVIKTIQP